MEKPSTNDLLREIYRLGEGEIEEYILLRNLDISHGYFCRLRRSLTEDGRLFITHPNRKACYFVANDWIRKLLEDGNDIDEDVLTSHFHIA